MSRTRSLGILLHFLGKASNLVVVRPASTIVIGILHVVFGLLGLLQSAFVLMLYRSSAEPWIQSGMWWLAAQMILGAGACLLLVVSGVGLLWLRPWGRKLSLVWVVLSYGLTLFSAVMSVAMWGYGTTALTEVLLLAAGIGAQLIYPSIVLWVMFRPHVKRALGVAGSAEAFGLANEVEEFAPIVMEPIPISENPYSSPLPMSLPTRPVEVSVNAGESTIDSLIPTKNSPALLSYYLGLFSLIPLLGLPLAIAAVVLGLRGLRNYKADPRVHGQVHAWIGVVCGILFGLFNLLVWGLVIFGLGVWLIEAYSESR